MKRGIQALVVGIFVFIVLNAGFFVYPLPINTILNPVSKLLIVIIGSGLYEVIFGSEYREFISLTLLTSIIIAILSYFLIPNKNDK